MANSRNPQLDTAWNTLENAYVTNRIIEGTISQIIRGGVAVILDEGLDIEQITAFLPGNKLLNSNRNMRALVASRIRLTISKLNMSTRTLVVQEAR